MNLNSIFNLVAADLLSPDDGRKRVSTFLSPFYICFVLFLNKSLTWLTLSSTSVSSYNYQGNNQNASNIHFYHWIVQNNTIGLTQRTSPLDPHSPITSFPNDRPKNKRLTYRMALWLLLLWIVVIMTSALEATVGIHFVSLIIII